MKTNKDKGGQMDMDKVETGELDTRKMTYDFALIRLKDISPSQLESLATQIRTFCTSPPKKDLAFDGAIKFVQKALSPKKEAELALQHPDKTPKPVGRPVEEDTTFNIICSGIIGELEESPKTIRDLRNCLLPGISTYNPKYQSFHQALARLKKKGVIRVMPDNITLEIIAVKRGGYHGQREKVLEEAGQAQ